LGFYGAMLFGFMVIFFRYIITFWIGRFFLEAL
jgi:hypothetical protein